MPNKEKPEATIPQQNIEIDFQDSWKASFINIPLDKPKTIKRNPIESRESN